MRQAVEVTVEQWVEALKVTLAYVPPGPETVQIGTISKEWLTALRGDPAAVQKLLIACRQALADLPDAAWHRGQVTRYVMMMRWSPTPMLIQIGAHQTVQVPGTLEFNR